MSTSTRWTVAVMVVVVALGVALWTQLGDDGVADRVDRAGPARDRRDADTAEALGRAAGPRRPARRVPRAGDRSTGPGRPCAASPSSARATARASTSPGPSPAATVVLNLWAYWCAPCAEELPAMAEYQRRVGPDVTVLTVHQDENETAALLRLAELGVRLPTLQDGRRLIAAALQRAQRDARDGGAARGR